MTNSIALADPPSAITPPQPSSKPHAVTVEACTAEQEREVLAFLARRPIHTVVMAGFIRDNGVISRFNRGSFHACRDCEGQIVGVGLIGHATLIEAEDEQAIAGLSHVAREFSRCHVITGENEKVRVFWRYYGNGGQAPRRICRELLFERIYRPAAPDYLARLRLADLDDLNDVMLAQAEMAQNESGINPMKADPVGFRERCARRIEKGRTWICIENDRLVFKADVMAETPEVIYLEGVYVARGKRGGGYGIRCLSQLDYLLLGHVPSLCLLVNERNLEAQAFYDIAGYKFRSLYDTIFLQNGRD